MYLFRPEYMSERVEEEDFSRASALINICLLSSSNQSYYLSMTSTQQIANLLDLINIASRFHGILASPWQYWMN